MRAVAVYQQELCDIILGVQRADVGIFYGIGIGKCRRVHMRLDKYLKVSRLIKRWPGSK